MSFVSLYLYVPDEGSLLPKYRDCTTSNDSELFLICCGVMLLLLTICIYPSKANCACFHFGRVENYVSLREFQMGFASYSSMKVRGNDHFILHRF